MPTSPEHEQQPGRFLAIHAHHLLALVFWLGNLVYTVGASHPNLLLQLVLVAAGYYANKMRPSGRLPRPVSNWEKAFRVAYTLVFIGSLVGAALLVGVFLLVITKS